MQEKIELNKVRGFGEIIEDSIQFFKQNWKPLLRAYFYICGFFWVASLLVSLFNEIRTIQLVAVGGSVFTFTYFLAIMFELLSFLVITLTVLSFMALYKEKGNEAPAVDEVWSYVKYFFFRVFGSYIALGALIAAGTLCCIIPGIYFMVVLSLTVPVMVMENATLGYAFSRSFLLIKTRWWQTLGVIIVTEIIIVAAMFAIVIPVGLIVWGSTFLTNAAGTHIYLYSTIVVSHVLQFLYLLPIIAIALTYFSFTEQNDYGTLLQRIMMLGKAPADNPANTPGEATEEY